MTWRWQPPVLSPVSYRALGAGVGAAFRVRDRVDAGVRASLCDRYGSQAALLTDSGTSALILALRKLVPAGGTVAYPGYACIDLTTAAVGARIKVRLYDLDPATLSPDLESVRAVIKRGVDAIVVAHLYGYPADTHGVVRLASEAGVPVIEDAAQGAGGTLCGAILGSIGDLAILSFSRGKGTTAGSGGALLANTPALAEWIARTESTLPGGSRGLADVFRLAAQRMLAHPNVYRLPASTPGVRLGEMVYRAPREPRGMSRAAAAILGGALRDEANEVARRRLRANELLVRAGPAPSLSVIQPIAGGVPGYLRFALIDTSDTRLPCVNLGAVRGYPMTLDQHPQLREFLVAGEAAGTGSRVLRDRLYTVPTHSHVGPSDLAWLAEWLGSGPAASRALAPVM